MRVSRRTMILGTAAAVSARPAFARGSAGGWYDRAVVIDALGAVGDPYGPDGVLRLSDRAWTETLATGVTMVRDTVMPVVELPPGKAFRRQFPQGLSRSLGRVTARP